MRDIDLHLSESLHICKYDINFINVSHIFREESASLSKSQVFQKFAFLISESLGDFEINSHISNEEMVIYKKTEDNFSSSSSFIKSPPDNHLLLRVI
jgi:hypothetical protein